MFGKDGLNFDFDEDGVLDSEAIGVDLNGDGVYDELLIDTNGDGTVDFIIEDFNNDGIADVGFSDDDGDGYFETLHTDTDGDGVFDRLAYDTDGDGIVDTFESQYDTNGDGIIDQVIVGHDYNQDGFAEHEDVYNDSNQDGYFEEMASRYDLDGDGNFDSADIMTDLDGDGYGDRVFHEEYLDTDGDGHVDTFVFAADMDGDGTYDAVEIYDYDDMTGAITLIPMEPFQPNGSGYNANDLDNFDPSKADPDDVSGDPAKAMEEWEYQGSTNRCALYSQKFVIEELTGQEIDIEELADLAEQKGWFTEEGGTAITDMNKVLEYYGMDSKMTYNNDMDALEDCLESGGKVIVSVDADEIWYGDNDDMYTPSEGPNHAVEVIGIDHSNPDNPMVILNDSGTPDGCGEMVPLDVFMDAWDDGNCQMITCY